MSNTFGAVLAAVMPHLSQEYAATYQPMIEAAMKEAHIDTALRKAAFLAQIAHESAELLYTEEIADGHAYEGRADLGNTKPGDGKRYKGRGPIQLTGRLNYRACGLDLGLDLEGHPELASQPAIGFRCAAWYWRTHGLNELADVGHFKEITRRINGGLNGENQRETYYARAIIALNKAAVETTGVA